jgi:hypothetical protein
MLIYGAGLERVMIVGSTISHGMIVLVRHRMECSKRIRIVLLDHLNHSCAMDICVGMPLTANR